MGMALAAEAGERMGLTAAGTAAALKEILKVHGLAAACPYTVAELLPQMELDKKNSGDAVRFVLLAAPGEAFVRSFDSDAFRRVWGAG
jgi:3-dehydroquinate synthetase